MVFWFRENVGPKTLADAIRRVETSEDQCRDSSKDCLLPNLGRQSLHPTDPVFDSAQVDSLAIIDSGRCVVSGGPGNG